MRPPILVAHVPNGGGRGPVEGGILKSMGVLAGFADLIFLRSAGRTGLMELKVGKNKLTPQQRDFGLFAMQLSHPYVVVRSIEEAVDVMRAWYPTAKFPVLAKAAKPLAPAPKSLIS